MRKAYLLAAALSLSCGADDPPRSTTGTALESCLEEPQLEQATTPAGFVGEKAAVVPMGRRVSPVGKLVDLGYFPIAVEFSPDSARVYATHSGSWNMEVVDVESGEVLQTVAGVGGFRGLAVAKDGAVYTAQASHGTLAKLVPQKGGTLKFDREVQLDGVPTDVELTPDQQRIVVVSGANSRAWELSTDKLDTLSSYKTKDVYPYATGISPDGKYALITHVGDDTLTAIERASGEIAADLHAGLNPMGLAVDSQRGLVYVTGSDSDTITVVSLDKLAVVKTVDVSGHEDKLPGGSPNEMALSPDGKLAFVSFADLNRVEVFSLPDWTRTGAIPTGHYPTGIAVSPDGKRLAVVSSKGWGGATKLKKEKSVLSLIDLPISPSTLADWTAVADENVLRTTGFWTSECPNPLPVPLDPDKEPVIRHVVVVVRENKTYDAVLGDFERGNGDPVLTVFGEEVTPNLHDLARRFVNLDNYYADSQESFQGHTWTTQADCNDFFEKLYPSDVAQVLLGGYDPSSIIAEKTIFDHLFEHAVTFRNYGEFEGFTKDLFDLYKDFIDLKYPYFNMAIKDVWKAAEVIREINLGIFPEFVYIGLPNDHTAGAKAGFPTPASMVADNDEATGMLIEAISHSPFWESTIVFLIEDDPQGYGGDHVHSHRSICVVISPWVRKEYTSSVHYSIPAMYRTIEMLLRVPPMHKNDAFAPPMYDIFLEGEDVSPDTAPYELIPRLVPEEINKKGDRMSEESELLDLSRPDAAPGMGYILWRIRKGDAKPPPYAKWNDR